MSRQSPNLIYKAPKTKEDIIFLENAWVNAYNDFHNDKSNKEERHIAWETMVTCENAFEAGGIYIDEYGLVKEDKESWVLILGGMVLSLALYFGCFICKLYKKVRK